ncbi:MAG: PH domain-containing protein [Patescibacteria group bacterium]|nr:PH domain-containing protein [Patescibacteria group bacterium]
MSGWVLSVSYIFFNWYVWFFDVYIITDKRIIEVKNRGVFSREITELPLGKIEDLNYKLTGFFSTLFDFGTINLFSTSKMDIIIKNVPDPKRIQNLIRELKRESFVVE